MYKKTIIGSLVGAALLVAPLAASAYYPYSYFTGTSNFVGGGGFSTGPSTIGYAGYQPYDGYRMSYNPMSGQFSTGQGYGMGGYNMYGQGGYGSMGGYGGQGYGYRAPSYMQYIPQHAQQYVNINVGNQYGYGGYGY